MNTIMKASVYVLARLQNKAYVQKAYLNNLIYYSFCLQKVNADAT